MKTFMALFLGILTCATVLAQEYATANLAVASKLASVLTTPAKLTKLTLTSTSANTTTFKLYDTTNTVTSNVVYAAYPSVASYPTNYTTTWEHLTGPDASGAYVTNTFTNTFTGIYTYWTAGTASTNERPRTVQITIPGNTTRAVDITRYLKFGLVAQASATGVVEAEYTK